MIKAINWINAEKRQKKCLAFRFNVQDFTTVGTSFQHGYDLNQNPKKKNIKKLIKCTSIFIHMQSQKRICQPNW